MIKTLQNKIYKWLVITRVVFRHADSTPSELTTGLILFVFGIAILNPYTNSFSTSGTYNALQYLTFNREWLCGLLFTLIGGWQLDITKSIRWRSVSAACSMFLFLLLAMMFFVSNPQAAGPYLFGLYGVICLWQFRRLQAA
jgi:hypothetical protein